MFKNPCHSESRSDEEPAAPSHEQKADSSLVLPALARVCGRLGMTTLKAVMDAAKAASSGLTES